MVVVGASVVVVVVGASVVVGGVSVVVVWLAVDVRAATKRAPAAKTIVTLVPVFISSMPPQYVWSAHALTGLAPSRG